MDDLQTSDDKIRNFAEYMKKRGLGDEFTAKVSILFSNSDVGVQVFRSTLLKHSNSFNN